MEVLFIMQELVCINQQPLQIKEFQGQRVVTFKDIDGVHKRVQGTARKRFNDNKQRFIEGVDYFVRKTDEAKKRVCRNCSKWFNTCNAIRLFHAGKILK